MHRGNNMSETIYGPDQTEQKEVLKTFSSGAQKESKREMLHEKEHRLAPTENENVSERKTEEEKAIKRKMEKEKEKVSERKTRKGKVSKGKTKKRDN